MSSSSVYQELQSCLTEPRVLWMKLVPPLEWPSLSQSETYPLTPPTTTCQKDSKQDKNPNADTGGWTFLQSLCNKTDKSEAEKTYIHPLVKRSSSSLSAKSLEMCTESLGCETGSNGSESSDDIALFSSESNTSSFATPESDGNWVSKRSNRSITEFPPPLSSMSKKGGVQVRTRREDGRLILEAVAVPSHPSCFKAERRDGRLRLQLLSTSNHSLHGDHEPAETEEEQKGGGAEEEDDGDEAEEYWEGNDENEEDETGMRKIPRPSRCSEKGNMSNQMLDWEPFWVAT
ncbi:protein FANTASTIC FOUR 2 [Prosopis cineraria]|uniref:protein FANTASTIC FOUR 2 n=1 Tax=Prosopis cineraria TaxID=364024 RepID=UPI00240FDBD2|nr:protein FANTASTIC FOUR 2 [Prosopis cineraria]